MNDLLASAEAEDWEKTQATVHTLKGLAANLSFTDLFNQSLEVETQVKGKTLKPESLEKLKTSFAETLNQIDKVIAENA
jgi:HPt (histidine-containing phosphotransfer) domain-containing protein